MPRLMPSHSSPEKKTVLVVDDAPDIRKLLGMMLRLKGVGVAEAEDGERAVELAPQVLPDLILMDLSMPVLDGYEATRRIKALPGCGAIPVVAVSAFCDERKKQAALSAGCEDCLDKPVDFILLGGLIEKHLGVH